MAFQTILTDLWGATSNAVFYCSSGSAPKVQTPDSTTPPFCRTNTNECDSKTAFFTFFFILVLETSLTSRYRRYWYKWEYTSRLTQERSINNCTYSCDYTFWRFPRNLSDRVRNQIGSQWNTWINIYCNIEMKVPTILGPTIKSRNETHSPYCTFWVPY